MAVSGRPQRPHGRAVVFGAARAERWRVWENRQRLAAVGPCRSDDMSGVSTVPGKTVMIEAHLVSRDLLVDQGARAATALDRIGVAEGDAIALLIRNDPCYFEIIQAA